MGVLSNGEVGAEVSTLIVGADEDKDEGTTWPTCVPFIFKVTLTSSSVDRAP
jgi:hypothetical protein